MHINWSNLDNMTAEEVENLRVELMKEISSLEETTFIIKEELGIKQKNKIVLSGEIKDLDNSLDKQKHLKKQRENDLDILTTKFWQKRRGA